jgi:light-regulated signal transduction histidine kinase (bacteriophytochrome)
VEVVSDHINFEGRQARLVLAHDVTERLHAEAEVQRLNAGLEERVRQRTAELESVNRELEAFSYSVSHDLRAPLRHIAGFAELMREHSSGSLDDSAKRYLGIISDSVAQMGKLIDDLLLFSKTGRAEMHHERIDMQALVNEVVAECAQEMEGRKIEWEIASLPEAQGDRPMLKQVWLNLISNAIKYSRLRERATIKIGCEQNDEALAFYVQDNGAGFDMEYADKLFGVFQRLHRSEDFEGTGVGLANVQRIVSRHGGCTRAFGKVDEGATFYFSLPHKRGTS